MKLLLLLIPTLLFASVLSPDAQALIHGVSLNSLPSQRSIRAAGTVSGILNINTGFDESAFASLGGIVVSRTPEFLTVEIPLAALADLESVNGVVQFTPSRKVKLAMDKAIVAGGGEKVYTGEGYSQVYTGNGVIVGVIDMDFQFDHVAFQDGNGDLRLTRAWDQNVSGTPPAGFRYGSVYIGEEQLKAAKYSEYMDEEGSHGTHVAGIAAGLRGVPADGFMGVAHGAELVFVATNMMDDGIVDGMKWIFDYAESVGKPAVINLSLGSHYGPHDGSSAVDRIIEAFTGEGKIVVGAAGNERSDIVHIMKDINNDTLKTVMGVGVQYDEYYDSSAIQQAVFWGERGQDFSIKLELYSGNNKVAASSSYYLSEISDARYIPITLNGGAGIVDVALFANEVSPLNGRGEVVVQVTSEDRLVMEGYSNIAIKIAGESGVVHGWTLVGTAEGQKGFNGNSVIGMVGGDSLYSIGEVGGTGRSTISVGAFTSRTEFESLANVTKPGFGVELGQIAPFSSMGPTVDGRIKPDISAPGDVMISAFRNNVGRDWRQYASHEVGGDLFGGISGTSMASPFVTGVVALMLQADPTLTPSDVKAILQETAVSDSYTDMGSDTLWGAGKVHIDQVLAKVESMNGGTTAPNVTGGGYTLRAAKSSGVEVVSDISLEQRESIGVVIYDLRGRELLSQSVIRDVSSRAVSINMNSLASGTYLYQITSSQGINTGTVVYLK